MALRNLFSRKARSLLSLLGMTIAIAGMVGLFSVSAGLDRMVGDTFSRIPGLSALQPGAPIPLFSRLPIAWGKEIENLEGVHVVSAEIIQRANAIDGKVLTTTPRFLFGIDIPSRLRLRKPIYHGARTLKSGRFLTPDDRRSFNAVISAAIAKQFNKEVGQKININGVHFRIVGIYSAGTLLLDMAILIDIETVRGMLRFDPESVSTFYIEPEEGTDTEVLAKRIREHFRGRQFERWLSSEEQIRRSLNWLGSLGVPGFSESSPDTPQADRGDIPIEIRSAHEWAARIDDFSADLDLFLILITAIGLTIAVLSIVNTMLMSVNERIIDFGILKANGWSKLDVLRLITYESAILGLGGGILGCLFGWGGVEVVNSIFRDRMQLFAAPWLLAFSVGFSTVLGMIGGLYPAIWAMRMQPMSAIRRG